MAISKVGLGWSVGERDFDSLPAFIAAMGSTGQFETANCKGNLGSTTTVLQTGGFGSGLLITSDIKYTGNNHQELAFFEGPLYFTNTTPNITIEHIAHYSSVNNYCLRLIRPGHTVRDCYAKKLAVSTIAPVYDLTAATAQRLVIDGNNLSAFTLRNSGNAFVDNIIAFNSSNRCVQVPPNGSAGFVRNSFVFSNATSAYFWTGATTTPNTLINSASQDTGTYSGNLTGYTSNELVDFANGDYRIKQTSDLFALNIGAFFEENTGPVEDIRYVTYSFSFGLLKQVSQIKNSSSLTNIVAAANLETSSNKLTPVSIESTTTLSVDSEVSKTTEQHHRQGIFLETDSFNQKYVSSTLELGLTLNTQVLNSKSVKTSNQFQFSTSLDLQTAKVSASSLNNLFNLDFDSFYIKEDNPTQGTVRILLSLGQSLQHKKLASTDISYNFSANTHTVAAKRVLQTLSAVSFSVNINQGSLKSVKRPISLNFSTQTAASYLKTSSTQFNSMLSVSFASLAHRKESYTDVNANIGTITFTSMWFNEANRQPVFVVNVIANNTSNFNLVANVQSPTIISGEKLTYGI